MWYKYNEETSEWYIGNAIYFPDGIILKDNHQDTNDGWFWSDEAPEEYLQYINDYYRNNIL